MNEDGRPTVLGEEMLTQMRPTAFGFSKRKEEEIVLCISFNQDKSSLALGTNFGYKIFSTKNFKKVGEKDMDKPIVKIQMLYRSNLLLLVEGELNPGTKRYYGLNRMLLWDDRENVSTGLIPLKGLVNKLKMRKDLIYLVYESSIDVFSLETMEMLREGIPTKPNPQGKRG